MHQTQKKKKKKKKKLINQKKPKLRQDSLKVVSSSKLTVYRRSPPLLLPTNDHQAHIIVPLLYIPVQLCKQPPSSSQILHGGIHDARAIEAMADSVINLLRHRFPYASF
jgi:hypothetical protein